MPRFRCRRRHHRGDAPEPGGNPSSTGHVWITIWRRYGRDPFRIFLATQPANGICPGNRGCGRQGLPGHIPWHRTAIRRICTVHRRVLCTAPYTRDLAGTGVIGARSHAGPGCRQVSRARLRSAIRAWIIPRAAAGLDGEDPAATIVAQTDPGWPGRCRTAPPAWSACTIPTRGRSARAASTSRSSSATRPGHGQRRRHRHGHHR